MKEIHGCSTCYMFFECELINSGPPRRWSLWLLHLMPDQDVAPGGGCSYLKNSCKSGYTYHLQSQNLHSYKLCRCVIICPYTLNRHYIAYFDVCPSIHPSVHPSIHPSHPVPFNVNACFRRGIEGRPQT